MKAVHPDHPPVDGGYSGVPRKRTCNRHDDCDAADARAASKGKRTDHCHDDCCEECFGQ